jgi:hypothetical protein
MDLSIYNNGLSNNPNIAQQHLFYVEFYGFKSSNISEFEKISTYVRSAKYPPVTISTASVYFYGQKKTYVTKVTYNGTLELSFDEFQNNIVSDFLEFESFANYEIFEDGTIHQNLNNSKSTSIIILSILNDGGEVTKKYKFYNAQLAEFPQTDLSYDNEGKIIRTATFNYDYFIAESQLTTSQNYLNMVKNIALT